MSSASWTAFFMDSTVLSMLTTTPFLRPWEGLMPIPMTSTCPPSFTSPTMAQTLVVPRSRPTTMLSAFFATQHPLRSANIRRKEGTREGGKAKGPDHLPSYLPPFLPSYLLFLDNHHRRLPVRPQLHVAVCKPAAVHVRKD